MAFIDYLPSDGEALQLAKSYLSSDLKDREERTAAKEAATEAIASNPADYGAWALRWRCAVADAEVDPSAAESVWLEEKRFVDERTDRMAKNYQARAAASAAVHGAAGHGCERLGSQASPNVIF